MEYLKDLICSLYGKLNCNRPKFFSRSLLEEIKYAYFQSAYNVIFQDVYAKAEHIRRPIKTTENMLMKRT